MLNMVQIFWSTLFVVMILLEKPMRTSQADNMAALMLLGKFSQRKSFGYNPPTQTAYGRPARGGRMQLYESDDDDEGYYIMAPLDRTIAMYCTYSMLVIQPVYMENVEVIRRNNRPKYWYLTVGDLYDIVKSTKATAVNSVASCKMYAPMNYLQSIANFNHSWTVIFEYIEFCKHMKWIERESQHCTELVRHYVLSEDGDTRGFTIPTLLKSCELCPDLCIPDWPHITYDAFVQLSSLEPSIKVDLLKGFDSEQHEEADKSLMTMVNWKENSNKYPQNKCNLKTIENIIEVISPHTTKETYRETSKRVLDAVCLSDETNHWDRVTPAQMRTLVDSEDVKLLVARILEPVQKRIVDVMLKNSDRWTDSDLAGKFKTLTEQGCTPEEAVKLIESIVPRYSPNLVDAILLCIQPTTYGVHGNKKLRKKLLTMDWTCINKSGYEKQHPLAVGLVKVIDYYNKFYTKKPRGGR